MSDAIERYFGSRGWTPFEFQREAWRAYAEGRSGLIHAPTGMGKTLAVFLGPVIEALNAGEERGEGGGGLRVLWVTPMRALATDTARALREACEGVGLRWKVDKRTGDTSSSTRAKQRERLPEVLVTTPESLSILLSYDDSPARFRGLRGIVVDEWHELLSSKRGVQTELGLARLRRWSPAVRTWGLSATLGNIEEALRSLVGRDAAATSVDSGGPVLVRGAALKSIHVESVLPESAERFPWAGHLGLTLLEQALPRIERASSTLLFTNTRSQAELWYRAILRARPDWLETLALHHGSIDRAERERVEQLLRDGAVRCVVCTSSLDLGVDFSPVDQVIQVGSPKGVARLLQRAGRSGHRPGTPSRVVCVPTNALELIEFAAARDAIERGEIEPRDPYLRPLDVLVQHLVTCAMGGGFRERELLDEIRGTWSYRALTDEEWGWALDFVTRGGPALTAYPRFARVNGDDAGFYTVASPAIARMHRLSIGTITSDASMKVQYLRGATLGSIEESFIGRLSPGDRFIFAGKTLELVRVRDMTAFVRPTKARTGLLMRWMGGKSPLSSELAGAVRRRLDWWLAGAGDVPPEMRAAHPLLELQARWSRVPQSDELLIESIKTRGGAHHFLYPMEGRLVHEGLAALLAYRLTRGQARSLSVTANDYGVEVLSPEPIELDEARWRELLSPESLVEDLLACVNSSALARRRFRDISRVAGLIHPGYPGAPKGMKQLQASSEMFFSVFQDFDPDNLLLLQSRREVLQAEMERDRLVGTLRRLAGMRLVRVPSERLTPFAFPLWAESLRTQHVSTETWSDRVKRMAERLERASISEKGRRVASA